MKKKSPQEQSRADHVTNPQANNGSARPAIQKSLEGAAIMQCINTWEVV